MLPGRVKSYKGPKGHNAIVRQIVKDYKAKTYTIGEKGVNRIISLFFGTHGIYKEFFHRLTFDVPLIGRFRPDGIKRSERNRMIETRKAYRRRKEKKQVKRHVKFYAKLNDGTFAEYRRRKKERDRLAKEQKAK